MHSRPERLENSSPLDRRNFLTTSTVALAASGAAASLLAPSQAAAQATASSTAPSTGPYKLPQLPYAYDALRLMETHEPRPIFLVPVVDAEDRAVGMINLHTLLQAGLSGGES